ncbi:TetR/AcrR family transcriptional regulator [Oligoflexus tunisiensis]|uniref:TetR/AcrR family transcriptional regulator n=1 Tax=Oligoflexus tunisiensis TaxID=708132 RepID=UPI00114CFF49|nr:TetR/AcrR family transcriptional regulator [Oligoflexus tunisiensis]
MPRPSRNIDSLLIKAGLEMLPDTGLSGLSLREVAQKAQVNIGMFHYHFKTKEAFARILLQELYEMMFARLTHSIDPSQPAINNLKTALFNLGCFSRDQHRILLSLIMDIKKAHPIAIDFVKANFPRHLTLIRELVGKAQHEGTIIKVPIPQVMAFLASSVAMPGMIGGMIVDLGETFQAAPLLKELVLSDAAIELRVRMALKGVTP